MDDKKLKNAFRADAGVLSFSEDILIKSVYLVDCKTVVSLLICEDTEVTFFIDGTNSNIVFKTIFGALHAFSLHSCLHEMIECLRDVYGINRLTIEFEHEKD